MADGTLRLVYAGALTPTYELEVAIDAVARAGGAPAGRWRSTLDLYGRGDAAGGAAGARPKRLGVADRVTFHGRIPIEDVPAAHRRRGHRPGTDPPDRRSRTSACRPRSSSTARWAKPVVASRLPMVERTFAGGVGCDVRAGRRATRWPTAILRLVDEPLEREGALAANRRAGQRARLGPRRPAIPRADRAADRARARGGANRRRRLRRDAGQAARPARWPRQAGQTLPVTDAATAAATDVPKTLGSAGGPSWRAALRRFAGRRPGRVSCSVMPATDSRIAIVGLGYVGLPLAISFVEAGCDVVGVDANPARVAELRGGHSPIDDIEESGSAAPSPAPRRSGSRRAGDSADACSRPPTSSSSASRPRSTKRRTRISGRCCRPRRSSGAACGPASWSSSSRRPSRAPRRPVPRGARALGPGRRP